MPNSILSIMVDQREPSHRKSLDFGVPFAISLLDAGDIWAATSDSCLLVIELKTPNDFLNTIRDNRLFSQISRMREISQWCYLLIIDKLLWEQETGKIVLDYKVTGWNMSAIWGALLSVQELGCNVVFCNGETDLVNCIKRLAKRDRGDVTVSAPRLPRILSDAEKVLAAFPNIGPERAMAIMKHCGSLKWALNYLMTLGEDGVPGVTDNIKLVCRQIADLDDGENIWPISAEENEK